MNAIQAYWVSWRQYVGWHKSTDIVCVESDVTIATSGWLNSCDLACSSPANTSSVHRSARRTRIGWRPSDGALQCDTMVQINSWEPTPIEDFRLSLRLGRPAQQCWAFVKPHHVGKAWSRSRFVKRTLNFDVFLQKKCISNIFNFYWATVCKTVRPMLSDGCPVCPVLSWVLFCL